MKTPFYIRILNLKEMDIINESLEDLSILNDVDPIEKIRETLRDDLINYDQNPKFWIK